MAFIQLRQWRGAFQDREVSIELGYTDGATRHAAAEDVKQMIDNHYPAMIAAVGRQPRRNTWDHDCWTVPVSQPPPSLAESFDFEWEQLPRNHFRVSVYHITFEQSFYRSEANEALRRHALRVLES